MANGTPVVDVQRPANGGEAIDNLAMWYAPPPSILSRVVPRQPANTLPPPT